MQITIVNQKSSGEKKRKKYRRRDETQNENKNKDFNFKRAVGGKCRIYDEKHKND
jgi:hypothetical protein